MSSFYQGHGGNQGQASTSTPVSAVKASESGVRIDGIRSSYSKVGGSGGGGPAFVGQVFSMLDPSGNGLMAVTTHINLPFFSKRTPEWLKKILSSITKSDQSGPTFRFFMDLNDAVTYVKRLKIPSGMVGACRLDIAYDHFKEKPHMFKFVPNEKQVKAAKKLMKTCQQGGIRKKLDGVPVFTSRNLNIAIATNDGIRWYTPYFFDKRLLDNILEASVDQHFHTLIQNRHVQRRGDVVDDGLASEIAEENVENLFEPPEVQELLDEMGHTGVPLSVISKAAEIQVLDVVDRVLLGNKWLRRATGIQPKFPYVVDSFEKRTAASLSKAVALSPHNLDSSDNSGSSKESENSFRIQPGFHFAFSDWFSNPLSRLKLENQNLDSDLRVAENGRNNDQDDVNPLLPKITMVGVSMADGGQVSRASFKKTMEDLTKKLEESQKSTPPNEEKDPLFVANVGDYSITTRTNSS